MNAVVIYAQDEATHESQVLASIYRDLCRLASFRLSKERFDTEWDPPSLVNETYVRIAKAYGKQWAYRKEYLGLWNHVMANVLVDCARATASQKRHWGRRELLDNIVIPSRNENHDARIDCRRKLQTATGTNRRTRTALSLWLQGMTMDEIAAILKVAPRTVKRLMRPVREKLREPFAPSPAVGAQSRFDN